MKSYYILSYDPEVYALRLHITEEVIQKWKDMIKKDLPLIQAIQKEVPNVSFEQDITKDFGFAGVCKNQGVIDGYQVFVFEIPKTTFTEDLCDFCGGIGTQAFPIKGTCSSCNGGGKNKKHMWDDWHRVCLTLHVFFRTLQYLLIDTDDAVYVLQTAVVAQMGGYPTGGGVHEEFIAQCRQRRGQIDTEQIEARMVDFYATMGGNQNRRFLQHDMKVEIKDDGYFWIECPGQNGCALYAAREGVPLFGKGAPLTSHNVDSPLQQLTHLVGFALLSEEVLKKQD